MNYNETQFAELSKFEENFRTALSTPSGWTRRISIPDQRRIKAIYTEATGERIPYTIGCGHCVLNLLKKAGKLYFADKAEMEKAAAEVKAEKAVETDAKQAQPESPASPLKSDSADAKPKARKSTTKSAKAVDTDKPASKPKGEKTSSKKEKEKV